MKKVCIGLLAALLLLALVSCGAKGVVGKWAFGVNTYEFRSDNTVSVSINGMGFEGSYEVNGDKILVTYNSLIGEKTVELSFKRSGDTLTLSGDVTLLGTTPVTMDFTKQS